MNPALCRGRHRIKPDQRTRRDDDLSTALARQIDQVLIGEERPAAQRHHGLAISEKGFDDLPKELRRHAFDHHVGAWLEFIDRKHRSRYSALPQSSLRLLAIIGRYRRQGERLYALVQRFGDTPADYAKSGDRDPHGLFTFSSSRHVSGRGRLLPAAVGTATCSARQSLQPW